jgi:HSP20 family protein
MSFLSPKRSTQANSIATFQDEMNRLFSNFFSESHPSLFRNWPEMEGEMMKWQPRTNLSETASEYKLDVELPGLEEKDIDVTFHDNTLFLKGEKKFEKEEKDEDFHRVETAFGSFSRAIPFAKTVDAENIRAEYKSGMLKIRLKKIDEGVDGPRRIEVK